MLKNWDDLFKKVSMTFILRGMGATFNFFFCIMVARTLNASGAGIFFLSITLMTIVSTLCRLGMDSVALRYSSILFSNNHQCKLKNLYLKIQTTILFLSLLMSICLWVIAPYISQLFNKEEYLVEVIRLLAPFIMPFSLFWIQAEFLKGINRQAFSVFIQVTAIPFFSSIGILLFSSFSKSLNNIIIIYGLSILLTAVLAYAGWSYFTSGYKKNENDYVFPMQKIISTSKPLYIGVIMNLIVLWTATIFLGVFSSDVEVGIFSVAQRTTNLISFVLFAVNSVVAPQFATLYNNGEIKQLSALTQQAVKITTLGAAPLVLFFIFKAEFVLSFFGTEFVIGSTMLILMTLGQFVSVISGSVGYLLMMSGNEHIYRNCQILAAVVMLILCFFLIPLYGGLGAALSTSITIGSVNLISAFFVWKKMRIISLPLFGLPNK